MRCIYWGDVLVGTDVGEGLYVSAKVRPRWFWMLKRVRLFIRLCWHDLREADGYRIGLRTAWDVAGIVYDDALVGPVCVDRRGIGVWRVKDRLKTDKTGVKGEDRG